MEPHVSLFPLDDPALERDACGVGFVAHLDGSRSCEPLREAIFALTHLAHRGAKDADAKTGDGAGIMTQLPTKFFAAEYERLTHEPVGVRRVAVGSFFLPDAGTRSYTESKTLVRDCLAQHGFTAAVWRHVPIKPEVLGQKARQTMPELEQLILLVEPWIDATIIERRLYLLRRDIEQRAKVKGLSQLYAVSLSCRTIIYKGMMVGEVLGEFYADLHHEDFVTSYTVFHQRYSTNTMPSWALAQPFHRIAHNGEINTIGGNRFWMQTRQSLLGDSLWRGDEALLDPIMPESSSDSSGLDAALELLSLSGRSLPHSLTMLMPAAYKRRADLTDQVRAFFDYHACISEPWDGPAAVVFGDGDFVGACLDRNGLRPARYKITRDNLIVLGSEVGLLGLHESRVKERGRLGPGQMIVLDVTRGLIYRDEDVKQTLATSRPYQQWISTRRTHHKPQEGVSRLLEGVIDEASLPNLQNAFGYSAEEAKFIFEPMVIEGHEPIGSMGDDTPLSALSATPRLLPAYFKQRFAQVTNPPIDSIRESAVMDLEVIMGRRRSWLESDPEHARKLIVDGPVLDAADMAGIEAHYGERCALIPVLFDVEAGHEGFERALDRACHEAERAVRHGAEVLVLSDLGVNAQDAPLPILLAVGAVNHHLRRQGLRHATSLIAQSGEPREVHHLATLIGYGADALHPYLAQLTIARSIGAADELDDPTHQAERLGRYREVLHKGLLKIMAKMGISVLRSYHGAQLFDIIGLGPKVVARAFEGTSSVLGGMELEQLAQEAITRHQRGFVNEQPERLDDHGYYRFRRGGELHAWSPTMLKAIKGFRASLSMEDYKKFSEQAHDHEPISLRDLWDFESTSTPIPIDEVEPVEAICSRFTSAAMSLGSLSPETHATLAIAMNRIGGKSNTGEGGEDPAYYEPGSPLHEAIAKIKQVASGRFGVTTEYLMHAQEIEIKMAQGSKPGEGGQIPGDKVSPLIARLRRSSPGVPLISPPPHHDIYSIEDLAQLIFDLRQVNPKARICVKLVSGRGVGTIAAGVAKAGADTILISGHDGGTGASPLSSIKNAGGPWELGLAEVQQVLIRNNLRERVLLRTDGGLKTGRDVLTAALLGAEEYNFGTAALVVLGCRYVRQCHSNTCPVGIATQREDLRARYDGDADQLVAYLRAVAQEVRELLAQMGLRSLDEAIGQAERLRLKAQLPEKAKLLDVSALMAPAPKGAARRHDPQWRRPEEPTLNMKLVAELGEAVLAGRQTQATYTIHNTDRTVGAMLSGMIAAKYGHAGLPEGTVQLNLHGCAGQSFGAFLAQGMRVTLYGESNDYVGKGMSGGELVVRLTQQPAARHEPILAGNTLLYGATGGSLFISGSVGERFAVRNSGAQAVVEGVGAHGCEYMTGGTVIILGRTGDNFAAGMTGGVAYIYDPAGEFEGRYHKDFVSITRQGPADLEVVQDLLKRHVRYTDSQRAQDILARWSQTQQAFWRVTPHTAPAPVVEDQNGAAAE